MAYKRILVPVDGSATSMAGVRQAVAMAAASGARLRFLHVVDEAPLLSYPEAFYQVGDWIEDLKQAGGEVLQKAARLAQSRGVAADTALVESRGLRVADVITREARRARAGLIVMGTHGRRGVNRLVMGSDAEQVVRESPVPVLLVRGTRAPVRPKSGGARTRRRTAAGPARVAKAVSAS